MTISVGRAPAWYSVLSTPYSVPCTMYSVLYTLNSVLCILYLVFCTLYWIPCTLFSDLTDPRVSGLSVPQESVQLTPDDRHVLPEALAAAHLLLPAESLLLPLWVMFSPTDQHYSPLPLTTFRRENLIEDSSEVFPPASWGCRGLPGHLAERCHIGLVVLHWNGATQCCPQDLHSICLVLKRLF